VGAVRGVLGGLRLPLRRRRQRWRSSPFVRSSVCAGLCWGGRGDGLGNGVADERGMSSGASYGGPGGLVGLAGRAAASLWAWVWLDIL